MNKGHGPGNMPKPGANVCPAGSGKGNIGKTIGDALNVTRQRVKTVTKKFSGLINRLVSDALAS